MKYYFFILGVVFSGVMLALPGVSSAQVTGPSECGSITYFSDTGLKTVEIDDCNNPFG